jgi:catechol 2,3-dioxygenase-like lactoylglutathione lyase family enzyme
MSSPGRVLGIGGIFFKSADHTKLADWYRQNLGIEEKPGEGTLFHWRDHENPDVERLTVWSIFPASSNYMDPSPAPFMINYIVDDLDALLAKLQAKGVNVDPKRQDYDYGRFAWIYDADGNKIELWQPPKP